MATVQYTEIDLPGTDLDGDLTRTPSIVLEVSPPTARWIQVTPPCGSAGVFVCNADQARTLAAALVAGAALLEVNA